MNHNPGTDKMKGHALSRKRIWVLAVLAVLLITAHAVIFYCLSSHLALSAGLVSGVTLLIVIKHLGSLGLPMAFSGAAGGNADC